MPADISEYNIRTSWKGVGEIDIERAGYLHSTHEVLEEVLNNIN